MRSSNIHCLDEEFRGSVVKAIHDRDESRVVSLLATAPKGSMFQVVPPHSSPAHAASVTGQAGLLSALLPMTPPGKWQASALAIAAGRGHEDVVRLLLEKFEGPLSEALRDAARCGRAHVVDLLLPHVAARHGSSALRSALENAAAFNHLPIIERILPLLGRRVRAAAEQAASAAALGRHQAAFERLFPLALPLCPSSVLMVSAVTGGDYQIVRQTLDCARPSDAQLGPALCRADDMAKRRVSRFEVFGLLAIHLQDPARMLDQIGTRLHPENYTQLRTAADAIALRQAQSGAGPTKITRSPNL